jgi:hypothetical protein
MVTLALAVRHSNYSARSHPLTNKLANNTMRMQIHTVIMMNVVKYCKVFKGKI